MELKIPPPVLAVLIGLSMWWLAGYFEPIEWLQQQRHITSSLFVLTGLMIDALAVLYFWKKRTTVNPLDPSKASSLVTEGIYQYTRNPMYVGNLLFLVAWGLWLSVPLLFIGLILYVVYMNRFQISVEERILENKFGAIYTDYCQHVRRWI